MPLAATPGYGAVPSLAIDAQGRAPGPGGLKSQQINVSSSGDTVLVTGQAGKIFCVYAYSIIADSSNQVGLKDGTTFVEGPYACGATSLPGGAAPSCQPPYILFQTSVGNSLVINLGSNVHVGGRVSYWVDIL